MDDIPPEVLERISNTVTITDFEKMTQISNPSAIHLYEYLIPILDDVIKRVTQLEDEDLQASGLKETKSRLRKLARLLP
jgi:hypothetical protein